MHQICEENVNDKWREANLFDLQRRGGAIHGYIFFRDVEDQTGESTDIYILQTIWLDSSQTIELFPNISDNVGWKVTRGRSLKNIQEWGKLRIWFKIHEFGHIFPKMHFPPKKLPLSFVLNF